MIHRPDIDGLRGVAIVLTVVFHAFPHVLPHGHVGVDVFFVISGYLITQQLIPTHSAECPTPRPLIGAFYARRIRRLFPALVTVVTTCLVVGYLALYPDEYAQLGLHAAAAGAFVLNLVLWSEVGYFDQAAQLKPLLHLWSLAVEEQFYLMWPLVLWVFWRRHATNALRSMVLFVVAPSFLAWVVLRLWEPSAAFYLPISRFWELGLGALIAMRAHRPDCTVSTGVAPGWRLAGLGWVVIAALPWPIQSPWVDGVAVLMAVAGTCLLVQPVTDGQTKGGGPPRNGPAPRVLTSRPLQFLGLVSYPLYLWHWPILSLQRLRMPPGQDPDASSIGAGLMLSLALALVTLFLIEQPVRRRAAGAAQVGTLLLLLGFVVGSGLWIHGQGGLPQRMPQHSEARQRSLDWDFPSAGMQAVLTQGVKVWAVGGQGPQTLFVGDSSIEQYGPRLAALLRSSDESSRGALFLTQGGQMPMTGVRRIDGQISDASAIDQVLGDRRIDRIVMGAAWPLYLHGDKRDLGLTGTVLPRYYWGEDPLDETRGQSRWLMALEVRLREWVSRGLEVHLVGSVPVGAELAAQVSDRVRPLVLRDAPALEERLPREPIDRRLAIIRAQLESVARASGARWIDPLEHLCDSSYCPRHLFKDIGHLRASVVQQEVRYLDHTVRP